MVEGVAAPARTLSAMNSHEQLLVGGRVRAETRWTLAAFGLTTAVALTDALLGARLILIGLLMARADAGRDQP